MFDFRLQFLQECKVYSRVNPETLYCSKSGKFQTLKKGKVESCDFLHLFKKFSMGMGPN